MIGSLIRRAAGAVLALAASALPARALEPEAVPRALWWRAAGEVRLSRDPLALASAPAGLVLASEWAPLYREGDRAVIDRTGRTIALRSARGAWRSALELEWDRGAVRGGAGEWSVGAERPAAERWLAAASWRRGSAGVAGSAGFDPNSGAGLAGTAEWGLLPGLSVTAAVSDWPERGRLEARWGDVRVRADGAWRERRGRVGVAAERAGHRLELVVAALDRRASGAPAAGDALDPTLGWRTVEASVARTLGGWEIQAAVAAGSGRQGWVVQRDGARYAVASGPVEHRDASLSLARRRWRLTATDGRWSGGLRGSLALWPFEPAAILSGTRRLATSEGVLRYRGAAIERTAREDAGWEGGMALMELRPRAAYASWQTTWLGLGREDDSRGASDVRSVLALGARARCGVRWAGVRAQAEVVQWAPLRIERADSPAAGPPGPGEPGAQADGPSATGGTVVRLTLGVGG